MLTAHVPDRFVPERTYALRVLCEVCLGVPCHVVVVGRAEDVRLTAPGGETLVLADAFWRHCTETEGYLFTAPLPGAPTRCQPSADEGLGEGVSALYGNATVAREGRTLALGADLLASAFYLLTGWGEWALLQPGHALGLAPDRHGRYPEASHWLVRHGLERRALVEEYAELLRLWLARTGYPVPSIAEPSILPTHDIDRWRLGSSWRKRAWINLHQLAGRPRYRPYLKPWRFVGRATDPYATTGDLRVLAEAADLQCVFFLKSTPAPTPYDEPYPLDSPAMRRLRQRLVTAGHGLGFHPGYTAAVDEAAWHAEHARLAPYSPPPAAVRGHYLKEALPYSWRWAESVGIEWDSTRGFSQRNGFRTGLCRPYPLFDFLARRELRLWERPLVFMETALLPEGTPFTVSAPHVIEEIAALQAVVRRHGGQFVFNWHTDHVRTPPYRPYEGALRRLYGWA